MISTTAKREANPTTTTTTTCSTGSDIQAEEAEEVIEDADEVILQEIFEKMKAEIAAELKSIQQAPDQPKTARR